MTSTIHCTIFSGPLLVDTGGIYIIIFYNFSDMPVQSASLDTKLGSENKGHQLMKKMGKNITRVMHIVPYCGSKTSSC